MDERSMQTRISYLTKITSKLKLTHAMNKLPTATEQTLFHEALTHVLQAVTPTQGTFSRDFIPSTKSMDHKQCLKKILDQLYWMERKRFYDPPSDNEIQHYMLIKKYTRSIMAFHLAYRTHGYNFLQFGCLSLFQTLKYVEDLMELNQHFADWTDFLLNMNIKDVPWITPLMGTKVGYDMTHKIHWSKERNYMFYHHKFKLALIDLRSSEFALCPPHEDEEACYVQVLNAVSSSLIETEDETNVYTEELLNLYLGMIHQEIVDMERNFAKIKGWILKCLSLTDWWEVVGDHTNAIYDDEYDENELVAFRKELIEKCEISNENIADYISQVDHYVGIAFIVLALLGSRMSDRPSYHLFESMPKLRKSTWEFVYALVVLRHGHLVESVLQEQPISQNNRNPLVPLQSHASRKKEQYENVIILEEIIDDLRCIGDSKIVLDNEEMVLVHKIWGSVASSTHFFGSVMAYEQREQLINQYKTFGVSMLKLPTTKTVEVVDSAILDIKQQNLEDDVTKFALTLKAYHMGLIEKLKSS